MTATTKRVASKISPPTKSGPGRPPENRIRLSITPQDLAFVVEHLPESPIQLRLKATLLEAQAS